jgi:hypothetical protein
MIGNLFFLENGFVFSRSVIRKLSTRLDRCLSSSTLREGSSILKTCFQYSLGPLECSRFIQVCFTIFKRISNKCFGIRVNYMIRQQWKKWKIIWVLFQLAQCLALLIFIKFTSALLLYAKSFSFLIFFMNFFMNNYRKWHQKLMSRLKS